MPRHYKKMLCVSIVGASILVAACSSGNDDNSEQDPADSSNASNSTVAPDDTEAPTTSETTTTLPPVEFDFGVSDDVVRVGFSIDLTGPRADLSVLLLDAHSAFADQTNAADTLGGRRVELVGLDHGSDRVQHLDNLEELAEQSENGVVIVAAIEGDDFALESRTRMRNANLSVVEIGLPESSAGAGSIRNVGSSPCVTAHAAIEMAFASDGVAEDPEAEEDPAGDASAPRVAVLAGTGESDLDSVRGVTLAVDQLGAEIAFTGAIGSEDDIEATILELAAAAPDVVWVSAPPAKTAQLLLGSTVAGLDARWWGPLRGWDPAVLDTAAAATYAERFTVAAPVQLNDSADVDELRRVLPESLWSDVDQLLLGWYQAELVNAALVDAFESGDLSRTSVGESLLAVEGASVSDAFGDGTDVFAYSVDAATDRVTPLRQAGSSPLVRRTDLPDPSPSGC